MFTDPVKSSQKSVIKAQRSEVYIFEILKTIKIVHIKEEITKEIFRND